MRNAVGFAFRRKIGIRPLAAAVRPAAPETVESLRHLLDDRGDSGDSLTQGPVLSSGSGTAKASSLDGAAVGRGVGFGAGGFGAVIQFDNGTTTAAVISAGAAPRIGESFELRGSLTFRSPERLLETGGTSFYRVHQLVDIDGDRTSPGVLTLPQAPLIRRRKPIVERLPSGLASLEVLQPLGRGQRVGLVGPVATGKSSVAQKILSAQREDTVCVYAGIGDEAKISSNLRRLAARESSAPLTVVHSDPWVDPIGAHYLLPLVALRLAKDLLASYRNVVLVLDDLTAFASAAADLGRRQKSTGLTHRKESTEGAVPNAPLSAPHVLSAALEQAGVFADEAGGQRSLSVVAVLDLYPDDPPPSLRDLWRGAEVSLDARITFDEALAQKGFLPAIDTKQLQLHSFAPAYLPPILRQLRSQLAGSLLEAKERGVREELLEEMGVHRELDVTEQLAHDRIVRTLMAQRAGRSQAELAVILQAASVFYFLGKEPSATAVHSFQEDVVTTIQVHHPEIWAALSALETLSEADAAHVLEALAGALLEHRYEFHLTRPEF